ncbi:MAG: ABC transporter ATP-binding protein [Spirochaetia bacterium]
MVKLSDIVKRFGENTAVNNVSLHVAPGEIFGILGPNGAGKTTLIRILIGLLAPNSGKAEIVGHDITKELLSIKKQIGVVPQELAIYNDLSAQDNIRFFASLYGLTGKDLKMHVEEALAFTGLSEHAQKLPKTFSGGMKRRLNIACGIAHKPKLIFMDEPTVGIDPQSRNHILESVKKLNKSGCTIIYTTHYMEEADELCSRLAILDHGKVIADGTTEELKELVSNAVRTVITLKKPADTDLSKIGNIQGVQKVEQNENTISVTSDKGVNNIAQIAAWFSEKGLTIINLDMEAPNLEMVFLALTGRKLRD